MLLRPRDARRQPGGFTLIELLIVIVILGVLAAVVLLAVGAFQDRGQSAACQSDVKSVEVAVEAYRAKEGSYPASLDDLTGQPENYLRELPNTQPSSGEYWINYNPSTGEVGGELATGGLCAGDLVALPGASQTATPTSTTPGGGGPGGGGEPTTTTTGPGGGNPTTTTTGPGGGNPTTTTTNPGGGNPTTTTTGPNQPPGLGMPVVAHIDCFILCNVRIDWTDVPGNPDYFWQNVPRSGNGSCNFGIAGGFSGRSDANLLVFEGNRYCFRVQVVDGNIGGPWSPVLVYRAND